MTRGALREQWQKRLNAFRRSGLSQSQWCRREGVALHQFQYWRKQLVCFVPLPKADKGASGVWCAVEVLPESEQGGAAVATPTGISVRVGAARIEVLAGFDATVLRAVVDALSAPEVASC